VCAETDTSSLPLFLVLSKFLVMALVAAGFSISHATPTLRYTFVIGCAWYVGDAFTSHLATLSGTHCFHMKLADLIGNATAFTGYILVVCDTH
jgi:hypothetical protein